MTKPHIYILGARPEIKITPKDTDGIFFVPSETRLSIEKPDGTIVTVSGSALTESADYLGYIYNPETTGYYQYETWVKDSTGREDTAHSAFHVIDRVG